MNQSEVLKMIATAFSLFAGVAVSVSLTSLIHLRRKTQEKHEARLEREAASHHGHPCH